MCQMTGSAALIKTDADKPDGQAILINMRQTNGQEIQSNLDKCKSVKQEAEYAKQQDNVRPGFITDPQLE